jgi:histidine triad (HIT) family protein
MPSVFTRILKGELPCYKIAQDEHFFAFLDIYPLQAGHTLVIPRVEIDYLFDLDDQTLALMFPFCKTVAAAIRKAIPCNRIGVAVVGLEVPHAHIHLIPISSISDMNFANPKLRLSDEEMRQTAAAIRSHLPAHLLG